MIKKFDLMTSSVSDGKIFPLYVKIDYEDEGVNLNNSFLQRITRLKKSEIDLFFYYTSVMSVSNVILTDERYRTLYREHFHEFTGKKIVDVTIKRAITILIKERLIVKLQRGRYIVNPFIVTRNRINDKDRARLMRTYLYETGEYKRFKEEENLYGTEEIEDLETQKEEENE